MLDKKLFLRAILRLDEVLMRGIVLSLGKGRHTFFSSKRSMKYLSKKANTSSRITEKNGRHTFPFPKVYWNLLVKGEHNYVTYTYEIISGILEPFLEFKGVDLKLACFNTLWNAQRIDIKDQLLVLTATYTNQPVLFRLRWNT